MKFISLSSDVAGYACAVAKFCSKYFDFNDSEPNQFFDYLLASFKSINQFLLDTQPLNIDDRNFTKNGFGRLNVKFLNYDCIESHHDLENIYNKNSFLQKYERKRERFMNLINTEDFIFFFRFSVRDESAEITEFIKIMSTMNVRFRLVIMHEINMSNKIEGVIYQQFNPDHLEMDHYIRIQNMYDPSDLQKKIASSIDDQNIKHHFRKKNKNAIVILTRGYDNIDRYANLIHRNKTISSNMNEYEKKDIDILIFHEGNISINHQKHIASMTKELHLQFISVENKAFLKKNANIKFDHDTLNPLWSLGYRHMCHFWFVDFWNFVSGYSKIIRIDEDISVQFLIGPIFKNLENKSVVSGKWENDIPEVVKYMINTSNRFFEKNGIHYDPKRTPRGPYSNVMGMNIEKLSKNKLFKEYINYIDMTDHIYRFRWGDLPLWGESLLHFFPNDYMVDPNIKYFHGSLNDFVNHKKSPVIIEKTTIIKPTFRTSSRRLQRF